MPWERRAHPEAVQGLYALDREIAGKITERLNELANMDAPDMAAELIENDQLKANVYLTEVHAHFIKFELWTDENGRSIMSILSIE